MVEASCPPAALAPDTECYTTDDGCALEHQLQQQRQRQQLQEQRSDVRAGPSAHAALGNREAPATDGPVGALTTSCMPGDCGTSRFDTSDSEAKESKVTEGPPEWEGEAQEEEEAEEEDENTDFDVIRWACRGAEDSNVVRTPSQVMEHH